LAGVAIVTTPSHRRAILALPHDQTCHPMTLPTTVILATDDTRLAVALKPLLPGLDVLHAGSPEDIGGVRQGAVWCFIDWVLEDHSGLELCRSFRQMPATAHAHITMVLEDLDGETRRRALKAGADDYLLGPLSPGGIIDRLERAGSGGRPSSSLQRLRVGALELDPNAHRLWFQERLIELQPRQFALMSFLMRHPDRVHSRSELLKSLGLGCGIADERTVDVWIARLRRELRRSGAPDPLRTVRDYGYVLDSQ
jgi:two-component system phosphate regulon response regulator PhoB